MTIEPVEALMQRALHAAAPAARMLRSRGWDATVEIRAVDPGRVEVLIRIALPEVKIPLEALEPPTGT